MEENSEKVGLFAPVTPAKLGSEELSLKAQERVIRGSLSSSDTTDSGNFQCSLSGVDDRSCEGDGIKKNVKTSANLPSSAQGTDARDAHNAQSDLGMEDLEFTPDLRQSQKQDVKKRKKNGVDLNQKSRKRLKVKKHRPRIFDASKPKKIPKEKKEKKVKKKVHKSGKTSELDPKTPSPRNPEPLAPKSVAFKEMDGKFDNNIGQTIGNIFELGTRSCRRNLNFHLEDQVKDGSDGNVIQDMIGSIDEHRDGKAVDVKQFQKEQDPTFINCNSDGGRSVRKISHTYQRRRRWKNGGEQSIFNVLTLILGSEPKDFDHSSEMIKVVQEYKVKTSKQDDIAVVAQLKDCPKSFKKKRSKRLKGMMYPNLVRIIRLCNGHKVLTKRRSTTKRRQNLACPSQVKEAASRGHIVSTRGNNIVHRDLTDVLAKENCSHTLTENQSSVVNETESFHAPVMSSNDQIQQHHLGYDQIQQHHLGCDNRLFDIQTGLPYDARMIPSNEQIQQHHDDHLFDIQIGLPYDARMIFSNEQVQQHHDRSFDIQIGLPYDARMIFSNEQVQQHHNRSFDIQIGLPYGARMIPSNEQIQQHHLRGDDHMLDIQIDLQHDANLRMMQQENVTVNVEKYAPQLEDVYYSIDFVVEKLERLRISNDPMQLVVRHQNASGDLVPYMGKANPSKRNKPIPKVDLDQDTIRAWNMLMENDGSEGTKENDEKHEKYMEEERDIFQKRADSFIARMHLIQGNRRFSPWKGSVVDSVVGVYLTQNVSDNLSSSAFMSLASRFPLPPQSYSDFEFSQELVGSNTVMEKKEEDSSVTRTENMGEVQVQGNSVIECLGSNTVMEKKEDISVTTTKNMVEDQGNSVIECLTNDTDRKESSHIQIELDSKETQEESSVTLSSGIAEEKKEESSGIAEEKKEESSVTLSSGIAEEKKEESSVTLSPGERENQRIVLEKANHSNENHGKEKKENNTNKFGTSPRKKKEKVEGKKEDPPIIDWDELRRIYSKNGPRTNRNMDSLDWNAVKNATVEEVSNIIAERGMNNILAGRIKDFLDRTLKHHKSLDLEWLRDVPPDKVKNYLLSIQGVGLKSVECVRLLTLHHHAFPVDTNVGRVAVRLGWVPLQPLPENLEIDLLNSYPMVDSIQKYLWPRLCKLDQRTLYELHYQLITFGKVFCTKRQPNCNACPMKAECRHFASAFARAKLRLPGPEPQEKSMVTINNPVSVDENRSSCATLSLVDGVSSESIYETKSCDPIVEIPPSPESGSNGCTEVERDIEDLGYDSDGEIPTIKLDNEEFKENLLNFLRKTKNLLPEDDMSKALVPITREAPSIPPPKLKIVSRLRTVHNVYELPDSHPLLETFEKREPDDPCPYLFAIWVSGNSTNPTNPTNAIQEKINNTVSGTILIPCRTANRGRFPLNGTYFQVNEVFADDESSQRPLIVPREWLWNLRRRALYCGTSATSIFKGFDTAEVQYCFWKGFICVRAFNRTTRSPKPLPSRFRPPGGPAKNFKEKYEYDE